MRRLLSAFMQSIGTTKFRRIFGKHFFYSSSIFEFGVSVAVTESQCSNFSVNSFHLQIPAFLKLCEDKIWDIRKAAADSIRIVGLLCSDQCRREKLCPVFFKLMNDSCRWVYRAAAESLGLFISSFARPCILGVAYKLNGDLYIPNPADAEYK